MVIPKDKLSDNRSQRLRLLRPLSFAAFLMILLYPGIAFANPVVILWPIIPDAIYLNALVGVLEGFLLIWWFGAHKYYPYVIMIFANYLSYFSAYFFVMGILSLGGSWITFILLAAFIPGAMAMELPFVYLSMKYKRPKKSKAKRNLFLSAMAASVIINAISNFLLFVYSFYYAGYV